VGKVADLRRMVQTAVDTFGGLDVLVNNAGVETRTSLQFIAQGRGGTVINISSVHEDWPMPGNVAYCVSKGGTRMLTRTAGVELGPHDVRVVNVGPGAVATPINASTISDPDKLKTLNAAVPLGRMAQPQEIADVVVFLASGKSGYLTATTVFVDGGIMQGSVGL